MENSQNLIVHGTLTSIQIITILHQRNFHFKFLRKNIKKSFLISYAIILLYTGSKMRWKLNCFKRSSLNQASVLARTHCHRLFTRDHDVTFVREYSVTLSNLFTITPVHRLASQFECSCSSLCRRYRAFSTVSKKCTTFKDIRVVCNSS